MPPVASPTAPQEVNADKFLSAEFMRGPMYTIAPMATVDGLMLHYTVRTADGPITVIGTEQTKTFIRETQATEALRQRTIIGTMARAAKDRTTNLVTR